ncbi:MAG: MoaD/ThiS family protein [Phycisphaerae bacterium]|nr:MoaD/ThiS family protein [Phycisphaerae bacterium]
MNVTIRLPAPLRRLVEGRDAVPAEGQTVADAIESLCQHHDGLRGRLLRPNGKLKPSISVFINNAQPAARPDTPLKDGDTLVVLQPVGGG